MSLLTWVGVTGGDKAVCSALAEKVQYIDFPTLKGALAEVVMKVSDMVSRERLTPALYLGHQEWSSNKWVTEGVLPALRFDTRTRGFLRAMGLQSNRAFVEQALHAGCNAFILFDDAIFSGQQIAMDFAQQLKMVSTELDPPLAKQLQDMRIILAPAYATSHGSTYAIESCRRLGFKNVTLLTSKTPILTIGELFDASMVQRIEKWRTHSTLCPLPKLSLTLFEHGIPDDESSLLEVMATLGQIQKPYRPVFRIGRPS